MIDSLSNNKEKHFFKVIVLGFFFTGPGHESVAQPGFFF